MRAFDYNSTLMTSQYSGVSKVSTKVTSQCVLLLFCQRPRLMLLTGLQMLDEHNVSG